MRPFVRWKLSSKKAKLKEGGDQLPPQNRSRKATEVS